MAFNACALMDIKMKNVFFLYFRSSLDLAAGCSTESNCPLLSSVTEVSASVQEESCPPLPGIVVYCQCVTFLCLSNLYTFAHFQCHFLLHGNYLAITNNLNVLLSVCEASVVLSCVSHSVENITSAVSVTTSESDLVQVSTQICR